MAEATADHDLLVELKTEMAGVRCDIKDLRDGMSSRVSTLERDKADRREVAVLQGIINDSLEVRMRKQENSSSRYLILMGVYTAVGLSMIGLILYHIFQR